MLHSLRVFLSREQLPTRERWQAAITGLGFDLELAPESRADMSSGHVACELNGTACRFALHGQPSQRTGEGEPLPPRGEGRRDWCLTLEWEHSLLDQASALIAGVALVDLGGTVVQERAALLTEIHECLSAAQVLAHEKRPGHPAAHAISSGLTIVWKVIFPAIFFPIFTLISLALLLGGVNFGDHPIPPKVMFPAMTVFMIAFMYRGGIRLKRVELGSSSLFVSNYLREIEVPLRDVAGAYESRIFNDRLVIVVFRRRTPFGERIVFRPREIFVMPWSQHPVVAELEEALREARQEPPASPCGAARPARSP